VIFHGAFAFDQCTQPGQILALIPHMHHHVYRAGNWLAETELRGRTHSKEVTYQLSGVSPGKGQFDPNRNLLVKPQQPGKPQALPYATLVFPLPRSITSLLRADIPRASFTAPHDLVVNNDNQHISTVQVFTYDFPDENAVMLKANDGDGHYWQPVVVDNHINLHIFAAEDHYHKPSNAEEDFNKCAELIGGLDLRLQTRFLQTSGLLGGPSVPPGVDNRETESLALRTERMARLGRLVLQKDAVASLAWFGNDALDGDPLACSGPVYIG
jgi:hypothetical protein